MNQLTIALQTCISMDNDEILSANFLNTMTSVFENLISDAALEGDDVSKLSQQLKNILFAYEKNKPNEIRIILLDYVLPLVKTRLYQNKSTVTDEIKNQYNNYPYPDMWKGTIPDELRKYNSSKKGRKILVDCFDNLEFIQHLSFPKLKSQSELSVLNAGCGTGEGAIVGAVTYPSVSFTCIDICQASLVKAKQYKHKLKLSNISFEYGNIMELDLQKKFDIISCSGVLHHLENPWQGLINLKKHLKPDGVIVLFVYGEYGRYEISLFQELIKSILPNDGFDNKIRLVKDIVNCIPDTNRISHIAFKHELSAGDNHVVDLILNVNEFQYTVKSLDELITNAGLKIAEFLPFKAYDPDNYIDKVTRLQNEIRFLSKIERASIADLLYGHISKHTVICRHNEYYAGMPHFEDGNIEDYIPYLNPYVEFTKVDGAKYHLKIDETYMLILESTSKIEPTIFSIEEEVYQILSMMNGEKSIRELNLNNMQMKQLHILYADKVFFLHLPSE